MSRVRRQRKVNCWCGVRGADPRKGFFTEYYTMNPQATAEGWAGGWWHTGDVVRRNEDGSLSFVDRRKNIIRRSGENIAALEVEAVLSRHPAPQHRGGDTGPG